MLAQLLAMKEKACGGAANKGLSGCGGSAPKPPPPTAPQYTLGDNGWMREEKENINVNNTNRPLPPCSIPRMKSLTSTEFDAIYRGRTPVIVEDGALDWKALDWTPAYLDEAFGKTLFGYGGSLVRRDP